MNTKAKMHRRVRPVALAVMLLLTAVACRSEGPEGEIRLEDGDVVVAGGGGIDQTELLKADWLAEPHSSCPTESIFVVGHGVAVED